MYVPSIDVHLAATLEEAGAALRRYGPDGRLLAGGTDLLVDLKTGRVSYKNLVSLNRIEKLRGVSETRAGLRIGALTTITQLGRSPIVRQRFAAFLDATGKMANPQIRNVATVGGNVVSAVPCADLPPILMAMSASVRLWSPGGERTVALDSFFLDVRATVLESDEVVMSIDVPGPEPGSGAAYARFGLREGNTIAVAAVAAGLLLERDGTVRDARIILGAVAPVPKLVESARARLVGQRCEEDAFGAAAMAAMEAAEPIADVRGSAEFRQDLVGVLARRALRTAYQRARETR